MLNKAKLTDIAKANMKKAKPLTANAYGKIKTAASEAYAKAKPVYAKAKTAMTGAANKPAKIGTWRGTPTVKSMPYTTGTTDAVTPLKRMAKRRVKPKI